MLGRKSGCEIRDGARASDHGLRSHQRLTLVCHSEARIDHFENRDYGYGEKHSWDPSDTVACQNSKKDQQWVQFDPGAHEIWIQHVVLKDAIASTEHDDPDKSARTADGADNEHDHERACWTKNRDELE